MEQTGRRRRQRQQQRRRDVRDKSLSSNQVQGTMPHYRDPIISHIQDPGVDIGIIYVIYNNIILHIHTYRQTVAD